MKKEAPLTDDVINDLHKYMDDAIEMLDRGEYVELLGLNDRVESLCNQVKGLPVQEAMDYHDELSMLIERLDDLKLFMEAHKEVLGEQMTGLGSTHAASKAYSKSSNILPLKPKDGKPEE